VIPWSVVDWLFVSFLAVVPWSVVDWLFVPFLAVVPWSVVDWLFVLFVSVVRLNQPHAVKYGLCLNMDEKYHGLKKQLSVLCGVPASRLLLVDVYGTLVRVSLTTDWSAKLAADQLQLHVINGLQ